MTGLADVWYFMPLVGTATLQLCIILLFARTPEEDLQLYVALGFFPRQPGVADGSAVVTRLELVCGRFNMHLN